MNLNTTVFIIGVSGCGKTTIGKLLAEELSLPFFDADDFHPETNIIKMSVGQPLNDADRAGWLNTINELAIDQSKNKGCVIACSALKADYRSILNTNLGAKVKWVYLQGTFDDVYNRISERKNHFMPRALLKSQFDILEVPVNALEVSITKTPMEIIKTIKNNI